MIVRIKLNPYSSQAEEVLKCRSLKEQKFKIIKVKKQKEISLSSELLHF
jgi:hypothetical protein